MNNIMSIFRRRNSADEPPKPKKDLPLKVDHSFPELLNKRIKVEQRK